VFAEPINARMVGNPGVTRDCASRDPQTELGGGSELPFEHRKLHSIVYSKGYYLI
jgi:hypothetical protein